jgi:dethiobiotin synthetase
VSVIVVSGTGTGVGKTVVTAALAALASRAGRSVAVVKPAQTGVAPSEPGDVEEVRRLAGVADVHELARFPAPLAPATAARLAGDAPADLRRAAAHVRRLTADADVVLVEGAGGLLVRYDDSGSTLADLAGWLDAPVVVVVRPDLGTLNHTALTLEALAGRGLALAGVVVGSWPQRPDLACRTNVADLEDLAAGPLAGAVPAGAGALARERFAEVARSAVAPRFGGTFDAVAFRAAHDPVPTPARPQHPEVPA